MAKFMSAALGGLAPLNGWVTPARRNCGQERVKKTSHDVEGGGQAPPPLDYLRTGERFVRRLVAERRISYVKLGKYVRCKGPRWMPSSRPGASPCD